MTKEEIFIITDDEDNVLRAYSSKDEAKSFCQTMDHVGIIPSVLFTDNKAISNFKTSLIREIENDKEDLEYDLRTSKEDNDKYHEGYFKGRLAELKKNIELINNHQKE